MVDPVIFLEMDVVNAVRRTCAIDVSASQVAQHEYILKITREIAIL